MKRYSVLPLFITITALLSLFITSCDDPTEPVFNQRYVVETFFEAGAPLPEILLSKTGDITQLYNYNDFTVSSADVIVHQISMSGDALRSWPYQESPTVNGNYLPITPDTVLDIYKYAVQIITPGDNKLIKGSTIIPGKFTIQTQSADTVLYQINQSQITITRSVNPDFDNNVFIVTLLAQDTVNYGLTPFYKNILENNPDETSLTDLSQNSSGIISEGNYEINADNTITIKVPWLAVAFYGPHKIQLNVIDRNLYDFYRSRDTQLGGSTLSPGEIYDVISNIDGATGIIGSYSRVETDLFILRRPF